MNACWKWCVVYVLIFAAGVWTGIAGWTKELVAPTALAMIHDRLVTIEEYIKSRDPCRQLANPAIPPLEQTYTPGEPVQGKGGGEAPRWKPPRQPKKKIDAKRAGNL